MKKKINIQFCLVGGISILLTAIFTMVVSYNLFQKQVIEDLKTYLFILPYQSFLKNPEESKISYIPEIRITHIDKEGNILYESDLDASTMGNHKQRPEILAAFAKGEGKAIRHSDTWGKSTYYYALRLEDGSVLRIAKEADSIFSIFSSIFPVILVIAFILFLLCLFWARWLTRRIIQPIENMANNMTKNMSDITQNIAYDELIPFAKTIKEQHNNILKQIKSLEEENTKIQMITDNMEEGLLLLDHNKKIVIANPSVLKLFAVKENDYTGKNILYVTRNTILQECIEGALSGVRKYVEFIVEKKQLQAFANPVISKKEVVGVMCFILDVTEKLENEKIRQEFTANVSHELKTPLTSISGYAELIEQGIVQTNDIKHFAKEIHKSANRLLSLINDIIQLSQLDEKKDREGFLDIDLFSIVRECISILQFSANNRKVTLSIEGEVSYILGNPQMIEELVYNLCDNAIRYNKENGTVIISVRKQKNSVILIVEDTGIGISKEHQKRIFERFYRVDKSRSKATGGTGLGLAIVKHIVEWHKAKIELESELGEGTKVIITFPFSFNK